MEDFMPKVYGADEFINKVREIFKGKYDKELATLQGDQATLQQIKVQSLIQLDILTELKKLTEIPEQQVENPNTVLLREIAKGINFLVDVNTPKGIVESTNKVPISQTGSAGSPNIPVGVSSASDTSKRS
jgi:hypothetical protein